MLLYPRGTNDFHGFSSHFAFGRFVFSDALSTPKRRSRRPGRSGRSRRRSGHTSSRSRPCRLRDARGAHRVRDGSSIFKCPEVGSYFLLSGAFSKMMSSVSWFFSSLFVCRRRSRVRTCRSKFRSRGPPGNVPFRASPGGLRKRPKWLRGSPGPKTPPK